MNEPAETIHFVATLDPDEPADAPVLCGAGKNPSVRYLAVDTDPAAVTCETCRGLLGVIAGMGDDEIVTELHKDYLSHAEHRAIDGEPVHFADDSENPIPAACGVDLGPPAVIRPGYPWQWAQGGEEGRMFTDCRADVTCSECLQAMNPS